MKTQFAVVLVLVAVALGACRRETPYEPMKLGASAPQTAVAR